MRGRRPKPLDEGSVVLSDCTRQSPGDERRRSAPPFVVALRAPRLEPFFKAVRGRRPEPLDEGSGVSAGRLKPGRHYTAAWQMLKTYPGFFGANSLVAASDCYDTAESSIAMRNNI